MGMKAGLFDQNKKDRWIELYKTDPECQGRRGTTCAKTPVAPTTFLQALNKDPAFKDRVIEAERVYWESKLMPAVMKRAVEGVAEPIIGGKFRDQIVAEKMVYSDSLLAKLLSTYLKEFRKEDASTGEESGRAGGVLVVGPQAPTPEEWEKQFPDEAKPKGFDP